MSAAGMTLVCRPSAGCVVAAIHHHRSGRSVNGLVLRNSTASSISSSLSITSREDLNKTSPRFMGVLHPLKVILENYPENQKEELEAVNNPEDPTMGTRRIPFSQTLFIEQDDFMENPPKDYYRLAPGREVTAPLRVFH